MARTNFPRGLTAAQWRALPVPDRVRLEGQARADLLKLWRTCRRKLCRRRRSCSGDGQQCALQPFAADFNNPKFGTPGFRCSFRLPKAIRKRWAELKALPYEG